MKTLDKQKIVDTIREGGCQNCIFKNECTSMEEYIRQYTSNTIDLCQVLNGWVKDLK